jgi:hypothetical protein
MEAIREAQQEDQGGHNDKTRMIRESSGEHSIKSAINIQFAGHIHTASNVPKVIWKLAIWARHHDAVSSSLAPAR